MLKKKIKIGIDIRNIGKKRTGDEVVFFSLVKHLALIDDQNEYFLFTDILDPGKLKKICEELGIENKKNFRILSLKAKNKFTWNLWRVASCLRKNPVDIYHTQYILPLFLPLKTKAVTTVHDISFNFYPQMIRKVDLLFLKILLPWSLKRADKIFSVSEFTKKELVACYGINPEKVGVLLNSFGEESLSKISSEEIVRVKEKYSLPEKFIFYVGTFQPRKNIPILLKSLANLKQSGWKLVLAGKRGGYNYDSEIEKTIVRLSLEKDVIFTGYVKEKEKAVLFQLARVFCFPSFYEGFGIPILEAMKMGVPVLASEILPHREIAQAAALFFNPHDSAELEKKIIELDKDLVLREELIREGKERSQAFSWKKTAKKALVFYRQICEEQ